MKNNTDIYKDWFRHVDNYRKPILRQIQDRIVFRGKIIELGSGISWCSIMLSRLENVDEIIALDRDKQRLAIGEKYFLPAYKGNADKITFLEGDFHNVPFDGSQFDFAVCDASLHHSDDLTGYLEEISRILKPDGRLIALREPILPSFWLLRIWRKFNFGRLEKKKGDIENIYSKEEWERYFQKAGFRVRFFECFPKTTFKERIVYLLRRWNGYLFNRYYLKADKDEKLLGKN